MSELSIDDRIASKISAVSDGIDRLKADRQEARHYAATLYAISNMYGDRMTVADRAALADAICACKLERGLIDKTTST